MGKKGRRARTDAAVSPPACSVVAAARETLEMCPAVVPRAVERLSAVDRAAVRALQEVTVELRERERAQADLVGELRGQGLPWAAIGWAVGTSGEAARQRWGK